MTVTVVLADDHPVFRDGLRFVLRQAPDIEVVGEAVDGDEALRLVADLDPDVVVMDLAMPVLGGLGATERLVARGARTRVLVLTMDEEDAGVLAAVRAGAAGYLVKGVDADQVVSAVRAVAAGHAVLGPSLAGRLLDLFPTAPPAAAAPAALEPAHFDELSAREQEVLTHLAEGLTNQQIAQRLFISPITVRNHVSSILAKLQVPDRRHAMLRARDGR